MQFSTSFVAIMRFPVITVVASMLSVVAAQECGPCGTVTALGNTVTVGSCPSGMMCAGVVEMPLLGVGEVAVGVSGKTIY